MSQTRTPDALEPSAPRSNGASSEQELVRFWRAFLRRRRLFAAIVVTFVALVAAFTILTPKSYTTTVRLIAGQAGDTPSSTSTTDLPILNALMLQSGMQTAETFAELVQQQNIAAAVVSNLNLKASPGTVLSRVSVKPVSNTAILNLSVSWPNRVDSARIANEFAKVFTDTERSLVQSQATQALAFLSAELPQAQARMQQAAADLANFQAANGVVDETDHAKSIVANDGAIQERIQTLEIDRREARALLNNIQSQMASVPANVDSARQVSANPVLADLKLRLSQVETDLAMAHKVYTDQHPVVIGLTRQRDSLLSLIAAQPQNVQSGETVAQNPVYQTLAQQASSYKEKIDGDTAQIAQLEADHKRLKATMQNLPKQTMEFATLQQRAKLANDVYQALQQKYNDATIARTTAISDVTIVQPASADAASVSPSLIRNLTIAPIVGILLASLVIFILDYLQRRFYDARDVRNLINLPVIASIPRLESTNSRALPWLQTMTVEAFLHLCVSLRLVTKRPISSLAIISPSIGDGKSTIAWNVAKAMSNVQSPVLLVDGDMRRSSLHSQAECENEVGLSDILGGTNNIEGCVHQLSPQLHLITSGGKPANPIGLLQSEHFDEFLEEAKKRYAMVIIDSPALACVADGFVICSRVEASALVIAANTTDEHAAKQVVEQFESLGINNVVGVVLNKDPQRFGEYSDYFAESYIQALPKGTA